MSLEKLLMENKTTIIKKWFDLVIKTYPAETQQFFKSQKDPFANPVGQTTFTGLKAIFEEVLKGADPETVAPFLDPIIRIRAVQNFSPSRAVAFILDLKPIVRAAVGTTFFDDGKWSADWLRFEHNVDALALVGFDIYMNCREKIFTLKANNERTQVLKTFTRAGLLKEEP